MADQFDGDSFSATGAAPSTWGVVAATMRGPVGSRRLVVRAKDDGDDVVIDATEAPGERFIGTWRYPAAGEKPAGEVDFDLFRRDDELALLGTYTSKEWGRGFWALRLHAVEPE